MKPIHKLKSHKTFTLICLLCFAALMTADVGAYELAAYRWPTASAIFHVDIPGEDGLWNDGFESAMYQWSVNTMFEYYNDWDCNDNDDTIHPGAAETRHDGIDQDCDGADVTNSKRTQVAKLYVATFNRSPADAGLEYWTNSSFTIEMIAESFFDQPETQTLYPAENTDTEFVQAIFNNLFNLYRQTID
ncbi:putative metal-binding motif-containing protein [Desulfobacter postgatei]|jgi:hypothetical protein|uniref:putative metal-binding motif-containing protein n=1 Tax=Desulfobacter postgatei TaxID=2293 RepID=UPI002A358821|nr:putative metal-binding motif-containing protein [Desulfobacter postgatei]MDX9963589.1 putative metal-binding motif-containing protein [Desulfobacter postgatei]